MCSDKMDSETTKNFSANTLIRGQIKCSEGGDGDRDLTWSKLAFWLHIWKMRKRATKTTQAPVTQAGRNRPL